MLVTGSGTVPLTKQHTTGESTTAFVCFGPIFLRYISVYVHTYRDREIGRDTVSYTSNIHYSGFSLSLYVYIHISFSLCICIYYMVYIHIHVCSIARVPQARCSLPNDPQPHFARRVTRSTSRHPAGIAPRCVPKL